MEIGETIIIERPMTPEEKAERAKWAKEQKVAQTELAKAQRLQGYQLISDPVFMQWQRGLKTEQDWHDAVAQVEADYPIPGEDAE